MSEPIDELFQTRVAALDPASPPVAAGVDPADLVALFDAAAQSRHLDFAARWLQSRGRGFYTIASAGHEGNAALGLATRVTDPALLHYRSGGFFAARAALAASAGGAPAMDAARAVLLGMAAAAADPISGGRHKVYGDAALNVIPQTSTIGSHLPRAVGLAYALGLAAAVGRETPWPADAVVVCSLGDASVNHSTTQGALNAAAYLAHRGLPVPLLLVCEDNGLGISTPTPSGWAEAALSRLPGVGYAAVDGCDPAAALPRLRELVDEVRERRSPAVAHLATVRLLGHAGSDVESAYRSPSGIAADRDRDPLVRLAATLVGGGVLTPAEVLARYEASRQHVLDEARQVVDEPPLGTRAAVMAPLVRRPDTDVGAAVEASADERRTAWEGRLPEDAGPLTLAQAINAALVDVLAARDDALVFGEDVAAKGGVYGVTRGLRRRFGGRRVFDTLLDEQTILGTALGAGLAGFLPIPEIQYLAYLHNAEDQLRGEAASLRFFSDGRHQNPMVVRIAGLAYQRGFGGHFHNDNALAVLRDIPGLVVCVPSHPDDAPALLRECVRLASHEGRVCVVVEPIALYHERDLHEPGDDGWRAAYQPTTTAPLGSTRLRRDGCDLLLVTFGNGVRMSLRAAARLAESGVEAAVLDLRWIAPLPRAALLEAASAFDALLVVDETRASGGVGEGVLAALVEEGWPGLMARVASADSYVPLGPAAAQVLLGEDEVVAAALALARGHD